jgi:thioesterase domain-containing protein/acyl carrier protein
VCRYFSEGSIEFAGRADDQVKVRGYRIEPGEIQAVLNEHRSVKQSVVLANDDERGGKRLVGYVVGDAEVTGVELKRHLIERLPEYMVPEEIVVLEEMPLTANGKIDRKRLGELPDARERPKKSFIAPRDLLEFQLVRIWENVLGIHSIGVTDNFFDLGGHSLLAVSLMARIRNVFDRDLPLSALFQSGTIECLASILRRDASSMTWSSLVELQPSGSQAPLFFVHPAGGNVLCYLELARCLGSDRPFYGFQTPGLYQERALYTRIQDLASYYIEEMRTVQPEGPYLLGGWSLGGIVAYEMAQQLVAQNQKVSQLLLLDSGVRILTEVDGEEHIEEDDALKLIGIFGVALPVSKEDLDPLEGDERIDYVLKKATSMNLLPPDVDVAQAYSFLKTFRTNERAGRKYVPHVYPGIVTLFRTTKPLPSTAYDGSAHSEMIAKMIQDPTMGWGELAAGGVQVIDIPGDHQTMMSRPHVETLALRIRDCLNRVEIIDRNSDEEMIHSNSQPF